MAPRLRICPQIVTQEIQFQFIGSKILRRRAWAPSPRVLLGKSHDRGAWCAMGHVVAKSWTRMKQLSTHENQFSDFLKGLFPQKLILLKFSSWHFYLSQKPILDSIYRWFPTNLWWFHLMIFFFFFAFTMVQKQYTFHRDYNVDLLMG